MAQQWQIMDIIGTTGCIRICNHSFRIEKRKEKGKEKTKEKGKEKTEIEERYTRQMIWLLPF